MPLLAHIGKIPVEEWLPFVAPLVVLYLACDARSHAPPASPPAIGAQRLALKLRGPSMRVTVDGLSQRKRTRVTFGL
jgi:hypothetical protein